MATLRVEIVVDSGQTREMDREFQRFHNPIEIFIGIEIFISLLIRINISYRYLDMLIDDCVPN